MVWTTGTVGAAPCQVRRDLPRQPMFPAATAWAPVERIACALRAPRSLRDRRVLDVVQPGRPAADSPSGISTTRRLGTRPSRARGAVRMPWPWARWQASWYATVSGSGARRRLDETECVEKLRHVTHAQREPSRVWLLFTAVEQVAILHCRSAPGGIRDNRVHVRRERTKERSCPPPRALFLARMKGERPAAPLPLRHHRFHAVGRKHAQRRVVDSRVERLLDAARAAARHARAVAPARVPAAAAASERAVGRVAGQGSCARTAEADPTRVRRLARDGQRF